MAQVYLRTKKEEGKAKLYTLIRRNGLQLQVCTGIVVDIREWQKSEKSQSAKTKYYSTPEGTKVNEAIVKVSQAIDLLFKEGKINTKEDKVLIETAITGIVAADALKVKEDTKRAAETKRRRIIDFYNYFVEGVESGTIRYRGEKYSEGSVARWKTCGKFIKGYVPEGMTFDEIDKPFADGFISYLEGLGLMKYTIWERVVEMQRLCNYAAELGINKNAASLRVWEKKEPRTEEKVTKIYLTEEELDAFYKMELNPQDSLVRDVFFLGCITCQRFSDYAHITRENFKMTLGGTPVLALTQKKTKTYVEIPIIDPRIIEICERNNYSFLLPKTNGHFNRTLKRLFYNLAKDVPSLQEKFPTKVTMADKMSERLFYNIDETLKNIPLARSKKHYVNEYRRLQRQAEYHNGKPFEYNEKGEALRCKWELVCSHTARRTGITNLYKEGVLDDREIRTISGHKSEHIFQVYVKATASEKADNIFEKLKAARG